MYCIKMLRSTGRHANSFKKTAVASDESMKLSGRGDVVLFEFWKEIWPVKNAPTIQRN
jgi:hypothetical protein